MYRYRYFADTCSLLSYTWIIFAKPEFDGAVEGCPRTLGLIRGELDTDEESFFGLWSVEVEFGDSKINIFRLKQSFENTVTPDNYSGTS